MLGHGASPALYRCSICGMARIAEAAPWCRHGDFNLVARRMTPARANDPLYNVRPGDPEHAWLVGR